MVFNVIGWCWKSSHKLNFCFPPDWWLSGSEVPGTSLVTWRCIFVGGVGILETGASHRFCWGGVAWKLVLSTGLLVNLSSTLGQVL